MTGLSIAIICQDAEATIRACLESVKWADEIVLVDSGSQDKTLDIAREYTDKIVVDNDWQGFGIQRNRSLALTTQPWVLVIDTDEVLPVALQQEIQHCITHPSNHVAFEIPRISTYMGKTIRFGDWGKDKVLRLFKRDCGQYSERPVHEALEIQGSIGQLQNAMAHQAIQSLEMSIHKMDRYSSLNAESARAKGRKASLLSAYGHSLWTFIRGYFLKRGFLDGVEGYIIAKLTADGSFFKYMKLYYLNKDDHHGNHR